MALLNQPSALPFEILSKIFQTYVGDVEDSVQLPHRRLREGPLLLSHICRYWRAVAFSIPRIWSTLHIDSHLSYPSVSHFLDLARESPLNLYVSLWSSGGGRSSTEILNLLLSRITQWRLLQIWVDEDIVEKILHRSEETSGAEGFTSLCEASMLEEVTVEGGFDVPMETSRRFLSFFLHRKRFPHLHRLHWSLNLSFFSTSYPDSTVDPRCFRWEKLTHLSLTSPPPMTDCLQILQWCRNLRIFKIDYRSSPCNCLCSYPGYSIPNIPNPPITPPTSLRELIIKVGRPALLGILASFTKLSLDFGNFLIDVSV